MKEAARLLGSLTLLLLLAILTYGLHGYFTARADAAMLRHRADSLIVQHRGLTTWVLAAPSNC